MVSLVFDPGGPNELTINEDEIVSINPVLTHTGESDFQGSLATAEDIFQFARRQDRVNVVVNTNTEFTGYITDASENQRTGQIDIQVIGIAKRLEETRPDYENIGGKITITSKALDDAIRDYWDRTPFNNVTVKNQPVETVETDSQLQFADTDTEFNNLLSIGANEPLDVSGGSLNPLQSAYHLEGENLVLTSTQTSTDASEGEYEVLATQQTGSDSVSLEYEIPSDNARIAVRNRYPNDPDGDGEFEAYAYELSVNGTVVDETFDITFRNTGDFVWEDFAINSSLSGNVSIEVDAKAEGGEQTDFDLFVIYDDRYTYNFDNSTDANSLLSGPELYPTLVRKEFSEATTSLNITEATVDLTINDVSNNQEISLSFDSGSTFQTGSNTSSFTATPSDPTRKVLARVGLSRWGTGNTETPTEGYKGQSIDIYELLVDLNNRIVIDELELTRNHFENLLELHEYGDYQWTIEHSADTIADMFVQSYYRGDVSKPKPDGFDNPQNQNREIAGKRYYNSIYLQGGEDAQGDRPSAERKDQDEINDVGREITPGVLRDPKITTEAGAIFRAQAILSESIENNLRTGSVTVPFQFAQPGYSYPVDFGNGEAEKVAEEINIRLGTNNVTSEFQFELVEQLREDVSELRRNARRTQDKV